MDKQKKDTWIFCMYMAVGLLGLTGAVFSDTLPQCVILIIVSVFTIWSGYIIKKQGTEEFVWKD